MLLWHDQTKEHECTCLYTMSVHKNYFEKEKYGTKFIELFKRYLKFQNFDEIFYSGTTRESE